MLQVFHVDVEKVDWDVAYVAMVVHICAFVLNVQLFFQTYVAVIWTLHMFYTYVAHILSGCCVCFTWFSSGFQMFLQVFQMHVSSVSSTFRSMLQVLHLDISKVDRVLHLVPSSPWIASPWCLHLLSVPAWHPN
jgi:hypothetical protein